MIDPALRKALSLLEQTVSTLGAVTAWPTDPEARPDSPWSTHAVPTLVLVISGAMRMEGPRRRCDLKPRQALLIEPASLHLHGAMHRKSVVLSLGVLPAWCDLQFRLHDGRHWLGRLPLHPTCNLLESALLTNDAQTRRTRTQAVLTQILDEQLDDLNFADNDLWPMIGLLWDRAHDPTLTSEDLVNTSGFSRASAYRRFRAGYGTTPAEAITTTRLALARWLLLREIPVTEVARRAGFPSRATFTRCWRRRFGSPPSQTTNNR
ncbi:MAG: helix-turn-helix domain-containing protein [Planctomycetota bacterium]